MPSGNIFLLYLIFCAVFINISSLSNVFTSVIKCFAPESINLPIHAFGLICLVTNDGFLKSIKELNKIFSNNDFKDKKQIIATCGSGVSACVISVALYCLGKKDVPIYDGSWTEWASSGQKIETGS